MVLTSLFSPFLLGHIETAPQRGFFRRIQDWRDYRRLAQMEDRLLCDIGLTRGQVQAAAQFWDAPQTWRQG